MTVEKEKKEKGGGLKRAWKWITVKIDKGKQIWNKPNVQTVFYLAVVCISIPLAIYLIFWYPEIKAQSASNPYFINNREIALLEDQIRNTYIKLVGGIIILIGLWFTHRRLKASEKQTKIAQDTLTTTQKGEITERLNNSIAHLNDDSLSVTIGGIYGLKRIAEEDEKSRKTIIEILSSYLTESVEETGVDRNNPNSSIIDDLSRSNYDVIQAFNVLMSLSEKGDVNEINQSSINDHNIDQEILDNFEFNETDLFKFNFNNSLIKNSGFKYSLWWKVKINEGIVLESSWNDMNLYHSEITCTKLIRPIFKDVQFHNSSICYNIFEKQIENFISMRFFDTKIVGNTFKKISFYKCIFEKSDLLHNKFYDCKFVNCSFSDLKFYDNKFTNCDFLENDMYDSLINDNIFKDCTISSITIDSLKQIIKNDIFDTQLHGILHNKKMVSWFNKNNNSKPEQVYVAPDPYDPI